MIKIYLLRSEAKSLPIMAMGGQDMVNARILYTVDSSNSGCVGNFDDVPYSEVEP